MVRLTLLLILVWGILGAPALCMAGALLHACECGAAIDCGHEEECSDDPCTELTALTNRSSVDCDEALPEQLTLDHAPRRNLASSTASLAPPTETNLPYPASQRPLLI